MKTEIKVAVIGAAGLIIAAIIGGWLQHRDSPFTSPTSASTASPTTARDNLAGGLTIEYPPPEGTEVVEGCHITARGAGTVSRGKALVVAAKADRDPRLWFEGTVDWNPERTRWSAEIGLNGRPGAKFTVYAVIMDAEFARYLISTNREPDETWWSSLEMPPESRTADQVNIRRSPLARDC